MFNIRNKRRIKCEINIVPLLDVLLVLLFIFMLTTPMVLQTIQVELPQATTSNVINKNNKSIIIEISGINKYNIIINGNRQELILPEQIISIVKKEFLQNPETVFFIGGAKNVPYEEIIKIINLLNQIGIKLIGLMTQPI